MNTLTRTAFKWGMLIYLAILPMAETIALRNLLVVLLLLTLLVCGVRGGRNEADGFGAWRSIPLPLWLWGGFLLLFPLWAAQPDVALSNLKGQWGESLAAWAIGLGAVFLLGRRGPSLWQLACASGFLVGLHLLLTLLAWADVFGPLPSSAPSWTEMWTGLHHAVSSHAAAGWHWQLFPWGFRGFDPMHGNLGYTASQAIALLAAGACVAWRGHRVGRAGMAILAIGACLLSIVIASSRGAVLFSLLLLLCAGGIYWLRMRGRAESAVHESSASRRLPWIMAAVCLIVGGAFVQAAHKDPRWRAMFDEVRAGFLIEEPVAFLCDGLSEQEGQRLLDRLGISEPAYAKQVIEGFYADGGRIVLMRVGLAMLGQQPFGLDGSRQSYKKMMAARCGHTPVFDFAHTHQGWIDTALALGWAGALLLAMLFGFFIASAWRALGSEPQSGWAFALVLLGGFWVLRGFADSIYREHYLQMQALLLAYVWGRMRLAPAGSE